MPDSDSINLASVDIGWRSGRAGPRVVKYRYMDLSWYIGQ
jgi:hypothetical protein